MRHIRNQHLRVRVTEDLRKRLEEAAAEDRRSLSNFIVKCLEESLDKLAKAAEGKTTS